MRAVEEQSRGAGRVARPAGVVCVIGALAMSGTTLPAAHARPLSQDPAAVTVVAEAGYLSPRFIDGQLRLGVLSTGYDGSAEQWVPAEQTVIHVSTATATTVPEDGEYYEPEVGPFYQFLGDPGDPVFTTQYTVEEAQATATVALGVAGHPSVQDGTRGATVLLRDVTGPGKAFAYDDITYDDGFVSRDLYWDVDRLDGRRNILGISTADSRYAHTWSFTEAGVYCLDVRPETVTYGEDRVTTPGTPAALTVAVGGVDPATVTPCAQPDPDEPDPEPDPDAPFVFGANTHADIAPEVGATGPLTLRLRKSDRAGGGNVSWHDFDDSVISIPDAAKRTVPVGQQWAFLGEPGSTRWNIPENYSANPFAPWLGVGAAGTREADLARVIGIRVDGVAGPDGGAAPGHMVVWGSDSDKGASTTFSTRQGLPAGTLLTGSHFHRNWDFSAPGVYCVGMDASGERSTGERLRDSQVLTFVVGDVVDPASVTPCGQLEDAPYPSGTHLLAPETAPARVPVRLGAGSQPAGREFTFARLAAGLDGGGGLQVRAVKGDPAGPGLSHDPDDVVVRVDEQSFRVPASRPEWGQAEDRFWQLEHFAQLNVDSLGLPPEVAPEGVTWSLTELSGPGEFVVQGKSNDVLLGTREGFAVDRYRVWPGYQEQNPWTFTAPGVYCIGMRWSATLASGEVVSDGHTLTFVAGDAPAEVLPCSQGQQPTPPDDTDPPDPVDPPDPGGPPSGREVLDVGHVDVFARPGEDAVDVQVKDGRDVAEPVYREPSDVVLHVAPWARQEVPAQGHGFLGSPGSDVWVLPLTEDPELLWPGWDGFLREGVSGYRLTLDDVRGPGEFVLFTSDEFGAALPLLGEGGGLPGSFDFAEHGHANWAFTAPGVYCLDVTLSALPAGGSQLASDLDTLLVTVGDADPVSATPADCDDVGGPGPGPGPGPGDPGSGPGPAPGDGAGPGPGGGGPGGGRPGDGPGDSGAPDDPPSGGAGDPSAPGDADPDDPSGPGESGPEVPSGVERIAGQSRIDTALALSRSSFDAADTVVVATAADFPDALAAGPLAGLSQAPVLLTWPDELDGAVADEIGRLGASAIVVVGGELAVDGTVESALAGLAPVTRLAGSTRYGTAVAVSAVVADPGGAVVLATGGDFPDALSGGVLAGRSGGPVLLTGRDGLPAETAAELRRLTPEEVLVMGGQVAVADSVLPDVAGAALAEPRRVAGDTRYATAAAAAMELGDAEVAYVSTGGAFADALAAVPVATMQDGVLLLVGVDSVPDETMAALDALAPARTVVLGGEAAVGPEVVTALDV